LVEAVPSDFLCSYTRHCFHLCQCCEFACDCEMTCPNNCTCYHDGKFPLLFSPSRFLESTHFVLSPDTWNANIVDCAAGGHATVPSRIPMDSTEVYLDGNDLKEIVSHQFIGRKNLRVLFLNSSNIEVIHNNSMSGLKRLQVSFLVKL
jgi:Leucine-rich repeat (LRR) protein